MATRSVIRRLGTGERDEIRGHLLRLDHEDRVFRFGGYASAAHIAAYCERLDFSRVLAFGYATGGEVRGLGQLELIGAGWPRRRSSPSRWSGRSRTGASGPRCCAASSSQPATG